MDGLGLVVDYGLWCGGYWKDLFGLLFWLVVV